MMSAGMVILRSPGIVRNPGLCISFQEWRSHAARTGTTVDESAEGTRVTFQRRTWPSTNISTTARPADSRVGSRRSTRSGPICASGSRSPSFRIRYNFTSAEYEPWPWACGVKRVLDWDKLISDRAAEYTRARGIVLEKHLGWGNNGSVWTTDRKSSLKIQRHAEPYQ